MADLKFIDLFCGSGGLSLGFSKAGFECELAIDFDKSCIETFSYNHPNIHQSRILNDDIHNQTKSNWTKHNFLADKIGVISQAKTVFSTMNISISIDESNIAFLILAIVKSASYK